MWRTGAEGSEAADVWSDEAADRWRIQHDIQRYGHWHWRTPRDVAELFHSAHWGLCQALCRLRQSHSRIQSTVPRWSDCSCERYFCRLLSSLGLSSSPVYSIKKPAQVEHKLLLDAVLVSCVTLNFYSFFCSQSGFPRDVFIVAFPPIFFSVSTHTHTHTSVLRPFFRDYPGEPAP